MPHPELTNILRSVWQLLQTTSNNAKKITAEWTKPIYSELYQWTYVSFIQHSLSCKGLPPHCYKIFDITSFLSLWPQTFTNTVLSLAQHRNSETTFMLREQSGAGLPSNVNILYWGDRSVWLLPQQPVSNCWSGLLLTSSILPNRLMKTHLIVLETWRNRNVTPVAVVSSSLHLYLLFHNIEVPFYSHSSIDYKRETEYCYGDFCFSLSPIFFFLWQNSFIFTEILFWKSMIIKICKTKNKKTHTELVKGQCSLAPNSRHMLTDHAQRQSTRRHVVTLAQNTLLTSGATCFKDFLKQR